MTHYEYKFVRIGEYGGSSLFGVRDKDRKGYEHIVHDQDGVIRERTLYGAFGHPPIG